MNSPLPGQAGFSFLQAAKEIRVALVVAGIRIAGLLTERHPPPEVDGQPLFDYGKQVQHLIHELETSEGHAEQPAPTPDPSPRTDLRAPCRRQSPVAIPTDTGCRRDLNA